ncbi:hypothetical protein QR680_018642 [Steinernema hermaphroditum]|uniref:Uncharacterized protein n=1 Tax=Steinernema hermaphroditum TaxID=289476 RepID=A0AA39HIL3_9BILA|nr:hypothetical protein QR680_018642 [Steinernema hermaphroditum]
MCDSISIASVSYFREPTMITVGNKDVKEQGPHVIENFPPKIKCCEDKVAVKKKCKIGYTCDGEFDPYHADYEVCCGLCHTERTGKVVSIICLIIGLLSAFLMIYIGFYWILAIVASYLVVCISAIYGSFTRREGFIKPFLFHSVLLIVASFIFVILTGITVICSNLPMSLQLQKIFSRNQEDEPFVALIIIILLSIDGGTMTYTTWIMFIHYCYIRDRPRCLEVNHCKERQRYVPEAHSNSVFFMAARLFI